MIKIKGKKEETKIEISFQFGEIYKIVICEDVIICLYIEDKSMVDLESGEVYHDVFDFKSLNDSINEVWGNSNIEVTHITSPRLYLD